jgi:hypothetical protein
MHFTMTCRTIVDADMRLSSFGQSAARLVAQHHEPPRKLLNTPAVDRASNPQVVLTVEDFLDASAFAASSIV